MPSFTQVLLALTDTWHKERDRVGDSAARIMEHLGSRNELLGDATSDFAREEIEFAAQSAIDSLTKSFDPVNGGFGQAPKFPPALVLEFLIRSQSLQKLGVQDFDPRVLEMLEKTCDAMARGGMYDQIGGGFARYSVDATWTVPHFEKMLYDNAQLLSVYAHLYRLTGSELALRVTTETADFLLREMLTPEGGFAAALDADSIEESSGHSHEGAFYAWTPEQLSSTLGIEDGTWVNQLCNVSINGTFEDGKSVLTLLSDPDDWPRWLEIRNRLLEIRNERPRPGRDDKVVASWNGLAIRALVDAGSICDRKDWLAAATNAAHLLADTHLGADPAYPNRLVRVSRDAKPGLHALGILEDQALVASAFLSLAQITGDDVWREKAGVLLQDIQDHFQQGSGLADTADDVPPVAQQVTTRQVDPTDNVTPSGWAATLDAALTYSALSNDQQLREWAETLIPALIPLVASHTRFAGWSGSVFTMWLDGPREVALACDEESEFKKLIALGTSPGLVYAWNHGQPLLQGRIKSTDLDTAYVCRGFVCQAPITSIEEFKNSIGVAN
jgi:uncharacterized protein YyaL (SSP411 family)